MLRDDSVHAVQCTLRLNDAVTVRANVVLPTPAAPTRTTPQLSCPAEGGPNGLVLGGPVQKLPLTRHES